MSLTAIKCIAFIFMIVDHVGVIIFDVNAQQQSELYTLCRSLGRISFPLFLFAAVEGYAHTTNFSKYAFRLFCLGIVSQYLYLRLINFNVFLFCIPFTLLICILSLKICDLMKNSFKSRQYLEFLLYLVLLLLAFIYSFFVDYPFFCIIAAFFLYFLRQKANALRYPLAILAISLVNENLYSFLAAPILLLYNGRLMNHMSSSSKIFKYSFYVLYPVHLIILIFLRDVVFL